MYTFTGSKKVFYELVLIILQVNEYLIKYKNIDFIKFIL